MLHACARTLHQSRASVGVPVSLFVTARVPRASPAIEGQRGERVEDPSRLSPAYPCFARPVGNTATSMNPTPRTTEDPTVTTPNLGLTSHWPTEATSEATQPGPPQNSWDSHAFHSTSVQGSNTCTAPPDTPTATALKHRLHLSAFGDKSATKCTQRLPHQVTVSDFKRVPSPRPPRHNSQISPVQRGLLPTTALRSAP